MERDRKFSISIGGINESVQNLTSLEEVLDKVERKVENINRSGGFQVVSKESNKALKEQIELEKANQTVQEGTTNSYREKQKLLSALGKIIKSMNTSTKEEVDRQKELISKYSELNSELKQFDAAMGNHQRNVGDYRGAIRDMAQELKGVQGELATLINNGIDKADPKFVELAKKGGQIKDSMKDAADEINRFSSDTKRIDDVINVVQSATAAFTLFKGAMSAFGFETENAEQAMQKLLGAMSILQSLQQLSNALQQGSATAKLFNAAMKVTGGQLIVNQANALKAAVATTGLTAAQKTATVASKAFGLALKAIPFMFAIGLILELVNHWEDLVGWVDKTFPSLQKFGGALTALKGVVMGVGKVIEHWLVNPVRMFAGMVAKIVKGDFKGAFEVFTEGVKKQFAGIGEAFNEGFNDQVNKAAEKAAKKQMEEALKVTQYDLEMLKARKGNQAKYSKEGIALQRKEFEQRKALAKGNADELRQIALDEANFERELQENMTSTAKANAKERADAEKASLEEIKRIREAEKRLGESFMKSMSLTYEQEKDRLELLIDAYSSGPVEKLKEMLDFWQKNENWMIGALESEEQEKLFDELTQKFENLGVTIGDVDAETKKYISDTENLPKELRLAVEEYNNDLENLSTETSMKYSNIEKEVENKIRSGMKSAVDTAKNSAKDMFDGFMEYIKTVDVSPVRDKFLGFIDRDKTREKLEAIRNLWVIAFDEYSELVESTEEQWNTYLDNIKDLYGEDSQKYKDACDEKVEAMREMYKKMQELRRRADAGADLDTDLNADGSSDGGEKKKLWDGEKSFIENFGNMLKTLDQMVLAPAMDTFSMYMDFAIELTRQRLDEVAEMHDKAMERVEESSDKIRELNESLKDSANDNLEATKQQLADEQLLYAQRLAEEQRLASEERKLKNKVAQQEASARKMELRYQMVQATANTAQAVTKALAEWGFPLGQIFAGILAALGAVQIALIGKQIGAIKPVKYAEGGVAIGPDHEHGGIKVGSRMEIEGGEFITNKKDTTRYLDVLKKINKNDPSVRYLQGNSSSKLADRRIRKFADGGVLNYDRIDDTLRTNASTNRLISAIDSIDMQPVVSVRDIWRVEDRLVRVRGLAGRQKQ